MANLICSKDNYLVVCTRGAEGIAIGRESKRPSLGEIIRQRAESDVTSPIWTSDECTGSYVLYRQHSKPLFIERLNLSQFRLDDGSNRREFFVDNGATDYLDKISKYSLPMGKISKQVDEFGEFVSSIFGVNRDICQEYGGKLSSLGVQSFSIHILNPERVLREKNNFLRYIRLKGFNTEVFNPGGIVCDGRVYRKSDTKEI